MKHFARIAILAYVAALLVSGPATAQSKPGVHAPTGNLVSDVKDLAGGAAAKSPGSNSNDLLGQLQAKFNAQVAADLRVSLALANQKDAAGNLADPTAAPCYQALLDLNALVNSFDQIPAAPAAGATPAPSPDQPGVVAHFEQLRIVRNALQSQKFKDACAPLVQDIQSSANQLIGQVLSIVGGAAKLGIAIP